MTPDPSPSTTTATATRPPGTRGIGAMAVGPLVGPECRRAAGRGWLFAARTTAALGSGLVAVTIVWWWWINWNGAADPGFSPYRDLRASLVVMIGLSATIALVFGPAVVAGGLSGDQERGSMGLLLTTRVNAWEIVAGRLAGRFSQVGMILLATAPPVLLLAFLAGMDPGELTMTLAFGPALAAGAVGLTAGIAVVSRRGREALIGSYALGIALVSLPFLVGLGSPGAAAWLAGLNPFGAIGAFVWRGDLGPSLASLGWWLGIGAVGAASAVWRLRPNSLRWLDGDPGRSRRGGSSRRRRVGPLGDRPMLWKAVAIDQKGSLGRLGKVIGALAVAYLLLTSTIMAGLYLDSLMRLQDLELSSTRLVRFQRAIVDPAQMFGVFIQWAVGLRAAVSIASERERGTWDALLTSPLQGGEILWGTLVGSVYSLRWLLMAALVAWSIALGIGGIEPRDYVWTISWTAVVTAFMASAGVRISLGSTTGTRAMALTIGSWLAGMIGLSVVSGILVGFGALLFFAGWALAVTLGMTTRAAPWFPIDGGTAFGVIMLGLFAAIAALLVLDARVRFDRLAGRIVPEEGEMVGPTGPPAPSGEPRGRAPAAVPTADGSPAGLAGG